MTFTSWLWGIVDWMSLPVIAMLAGILVWRKLHREIPFFFTYILTAGIDGVVRVAAQHFGDARTYFYVYWISDLVLGVFNILAVYELFGVRLFPRFYKTNIYRYLFAVTGVVIIFLGWFATLRPRDKYATLIIQDRVLDFFVVAMLAFFLVLMVVMGREWTKYDFGIAFGFVIGNAGSLVGSSMWVRSHYQQIVNELAPMTFDLACLIWLYTFWPKKKTFDQRTPAPLRPEMLEDARRWESTLKGWIAPGKRSPRDGE